MFLTQNIKARGKRRKENSNINIVKKKKSKEQKSGTDTKLDFLVIRLCLQHIT